MTKAHHAMILVFILIILNVVDLIVHIATDQVELLRVTSNLFIISSGVLLLMNHRYSALLATSLALYIGLNTLFIVLQGIGPAGALFIAATTLLGIFALRSTRRSI